MVRVVIIGVLGGTLLSKKPIGWGICMDPVAEIELFLVDDLAVLCIRIESYCTGLMANLAGAWSLGFTLAYYSLFWCMTTEASWNLLEKIDP